MGQIAADTFRRLYLLYLLGLFPKGSYGLMRLHKVTYITEREEGNPRPFEFKRYNFGQYSDTLEDIKDQLVAMGYIGVEPLDTSQEVTITIGDRHFTYRDGGNRLFVADNAVTSTFAEVLEGAFPGETRLMRSVMREFAFLPQEELVKRCYAFPEFEAVEMGEPLFASDLPEYVDVQLSDDVCADLELALDPKAAPALLRLMEAIDSTEFDLSKVDGFELQASAS